MSWKPEDGEHFIGLVAVHDVDGMAEWLEAYADDLEGVYALLLALPDTVCLTVEAALKRTGQPVAIEATNRGPEAIDAAALLQTRTSGGRDALDAAVDRLVHDALGRDDPLHLLHVVVSLVDILSCALDALRGRVSAGER
jgi:hypothetical protein